MAGEPHERKEQLIARIRGGRARLHETFADLEQRVAAVDKVKTQALRYGRWTVIVVGAITVTLTATLLFRALVSPRRRRRR